MRHVRHFPARSPELSQHFLRPGAARRIVASIPLQRHRAIVEIGAGRGALTEALAAGGVHVIAIEKDAGLAGPLRARFYGRTNVSCHHADALTFAFPRAPYAVVANLPYGSTSAIVRRLLSQDRPPDEAFLIVQAEAAAKFAGAPRESMFSLLHKPWFDMRIVGGVPRGAFEPRPRVRSSVLRIAPRPFPLVDASSARAYRQFIATVFAGRGGSVRSALKGWLSDRQLVRLSREAGFMLSARPLDLTFEQWLQAFRVAAPRHACRDGRTGLAPAPATRATPRARA